MGGWAPYNWNLVRDYEEKEEKKKTEKKGKEIKKTTEAKNKKA